MNPVAAHFKNNSSPLTPEPTGQEPLLPTFEDIKCVAFDIYGTLMISGSGDIGLSDADHLSGFIRKLLEEVGACNIPEHPVDTFVGLITKEHELSRAQGIDAPEVDILETWREFLALSQAPELGQEQLELLAARYELATNPVWPMPGTEEVIAEIKQRGLQLGIVSNAQFYTPHLFEAFIGKPLEELGFDPDLCYYSYQAKRAKPGVWLYEQLRDALVSLEIEPEETLYIGNDALKDVHPAAELGFKTVLFAGDQRSLRLREDHPDLNSPDAIITDLQQITENLLPTFG